MAVRKPLVLVDGRLRELASGDTLAGVDEMSNLSERVDFVGDTLIYKGYA